MSTVHNFKVGDIVKVIDSGFGMSSLNKGKETIITKIGGTYDSDGDGVKTADFKNPVYSDWIRYDMFELVKKANEWMGGKRCLNPNLK